MGLEQAYVQDRITAFAGEKAFAQRLHLAPNIVQTAALETLQELCVGDVARCSAVRQCGIVFRHDCM